MPKKHFKKEALDAMCNFCHGFGPQEGICGACGAPSLSLSGACGMIGFSSPPAPPTQNKIELNKEALKNDDSWPKENHFIFDFLM